MLRSAKTNLLLTLTRWVKEASPFIALVQHFYTQYDVGPSMTESTLQKATDCGSFTVSYCTKHAPPRLPLCTWVYQYEPKFTTLDQRSPITHAILLYRKTCAMSTWPRHKNGRCSMSWMRVRQQNGKETLSIPWPWTSLQPALVREGVKKIWTF